VSAKAETTTDLAASVGDGTSPALDARLAGSGLLDAPSGRRSRRFAPGMHRNGGRLAYSSKRSPEPLTVDEQAALAFAAGSPAMRSRSCRMRPAMRLVDATYEERKGRFRFRRYRERVARCRVGPRWHLGVLGQDDRGSECLLQLRVGALRALPGRQRPVPHHARVPGQPCRSRFLWTLLFAGGAPRDGTRELLGAEPLARRPRIAATTLTF
jgi:hypothetical protein